MNNIKKKYKNKGIFIYDMKKEFKGGCVVFFCKKETAQLLIVNGNLLIEVKACVEHGSKIKEFVNQEKEEPITTFNQVNDLVNLMVF